MTQQLDILHGYLAQAHSTLGDAVEATTFNDSLQHLMAAVRDVRDAVDCAAKIMEATQ